MSGSIFDAEAGARTAGRVAGSTCGSSGSLGGALVVAEGAEGLDAAGERAEAGGVMGT